MRKITLVIVGTALILGACNTGTESPTTEALPVEAVSPEPEPCIDTVKSVAAMMRAMDGNDRVIEAAQNYDVAGASVALRTVARDVKEAATYSAADPAISEPLVRAAEEYDLAADAMGLAAQTGSAGSVSEATEHIQRATAYIEESTAGIERSSLPAC